jgi:hypothetical protein
MGDMPTIVLESFLATGAYLGLFETWSSSFLNETAFLSPRLPSSSAASSIFCSYPLG